MKKKSKSRVPTSVSKMVEGIIDGSSVICPKCNAILTGDNSHKLDDYGDNFRYWWFLRKCDTCGSIVKYYTDTSFKIVETPEFPIRILPRLFRLEV